MVEQALKSAFGPCSVSYAQPRTTDMSMVLMRLGQLYRSYARCIMQHGHGRCTCMVATCCVEHARTARQSCGSFANSLRLHRW